MSRETQIKKFKLLKELHVDTNGKMILGGSIALKRLGFLERETGDIDIIVSEGLFNKIKGKWVRTTAEQQKKRESYDLRSVREKVNDIDICFFIEEYMNHDDSIPMVIGDIVFYVQKPQIILQAKKKYYEEMGIEKHKIDLDYIKEKFNYSV